jgi:hypothetical protein
MSRYSFWYYLHFAAADLEFDHVWIVVTRAAPERAALERAGFKWWSALSLTSRVPRSAPAAYSNSVIFIAAHTATIQAFSLRTPMRNRRAFLELEAPAAPSPDAQLSVPASHLPTPRATG